MGISGAQHACMPPPHRHDHAMSSTDFQNEQAAEQRAGRYALILFLVVMLANLVVNATTIIMEHAGDTEPYNGAHAWFTETTSIIYILALFPVVMWWERRHPVNLSNWQQSLAFHLVGLVIFSVVHVIAMALTRETLHPLFFGDEYRFFNNPLINFIYEMRKDALTYTSMLLALVSFRVIEFHRMDAAAARAEARTSHRITLKCGGRIMQLAAEDFVSAKSAGNYVEARFAEGSHLARMTLAQLDTLLREAAIPAIRVHRSWLVNRDLVSQIEPTGEGDVSITLTNGDTIPGSRRYRDRLKVA